MSPIKNLDLSILRRTAAEIAAAALFELYPNVELFGGGETSIGFYYKFYCPHPIQLTVLEERMRQIIREKRPIRTMEMVGFSASELLKKDGLTSRAEEVGEGLVEIVEIGTFHDLSLGPHLKNTAELAAFKIELEEGEIVGTCAFSKEDHKKFLKKLSHYTEPEKIGEKMGLWKEDLWLIKGIEVRQKVIDFLKKEWFQDAAEVSAAPQADRLALHKKVGKGKVGEVWVDPEGGGWRVQLTFFDRLEEEMISSLHSIAKTLTILGFDPIPLPTGWGSDYELEDELGRKWPLVRLKKISKKGSARADYVAVVEVEKLVALLLEKNLLLRMVEF